MFDMTYMSKITFNMIMFSKVWYNFNSMIKQTYFSKIASNTIQLFSYRIKIFRLILTKN